MLDQIEVYARPDMEHSSIPPQNRRTVSPVTMASRASLYENNAFTSGNQTHTLDRECTLIYRHATQASILPSASRYDSVNTLKSGRDVTSIATVHLACSLKATRS